MQTVNIRFRALFYNFTGHDMLFKETLCLYSYDIIYAIISVPLFLYIHGCVPDTRSGHLLYIPLQ